MTEIQLITLAVALAAAFVWIQWKRTSGRLVRALGVVVIIGAWLVFRLIEGFV